MQTPSTRTFKGYWCLPSAPDKEVAGILTIALDGRSVLELMGSFARNEDLFLDLRHEDSIWGRCYDEQNKGNKITLLDCYSSYSINFDLGFPLVRYSSRCALIGTHILSENAPIFSRAILHFNGLTEWCPPGTVRSAHGDNSMTVSVDTTRGESSILASQELNDGIIVNLLKGASYYTDQYKYSIEPESLLEVKKEGISLKQLIDVSGRFEEFLSFATLCPLEHSRITLFSEQEVQVFGHGNKHHRPIELVTRLVINNPNVDFKPHTFLFKYRDITADFGAIFERYYSNTSIKQIWNNMLDSLEKKRIFTSNDFLIVVQAVDGFSQRFRKEADFLVQIRALRDEFRDIDKLVLTDKDLNSIRGSRHYYSHILKLDEKEKKQAVDGKDLYILTDKLRILLICCLLSFLGMDKERINDLLNHCHNPLLQTE